MKPWIKEIEPKIRKLYDREIGDSNELINFKMTENLECEIQKKDGSRTKIPRRIIDTFESDPNAKKILLKKLKDFKDPS